MVFGRDLGPMIRKREDLFLFRLSGGDAESWLQGQITQDIRLANAVTWLLALLVKPTGQLLAVLEIKQDATGYLILTGQPQVLTNRVEEMVILEDVGLDPLEATLYSSFNTLEGDETSWLPGLRHSFHLLDGAIMDDAEWDALCLLNKVPEVGLDTTEKTLPPELGSFAERAVSTNKGCYTGQEVLVRIHSRGHINRNWGVVTASQEISPGDTVEAGGATGKILRVSAHGLGMWLGSVTMPVAAWLGPMTVNGSLVTPL